MANEATSGATSGAAGGGGQGRAAAARSTAGASTETMPDTTDQSLAEQVDTLKSELTRVSTMLSDLVRSGAREGRATVERTAGYYKREGQRQADAALEEARAYSEALEDRIRGNPFSAVLVALGLGFLVGLMSRR
jgi:ElaB/YqjD/DUF883 family membrane-anchored ribosome-binding protein